MILLNIVEAREIKCVEQMLFGKYLLRIDTAWGQQHQAADRSDAGSVGIAEITFLAGGFARPSKQEEFGSVQTNTVPSVVGFEIYFSYWN